MSKFIVNHHQIFDNYQRSFKLFCLHILQSDNVRRKLDHNNLKCITEAKLTWYGVKIKLDFALETAPSLVLDLELWTHFKMIQSQTSERTGGWANRNQKNKTIDHANVKCWYFPWCHISAARGKMERDSSNSLLEVTSYLSLQTCLL